MNWSELQGHFPFHLGLVAEEVSPDLDHVVRFALEMGIEYLECGRLWDEPIARCTVDTLKRARALLEQHGIGLRVASPETFKVVLLGDVPLADVPHCPPFQQELQALRGQLAAAKFLGAPLARVYAFRRDGMVALGNPSLRYPRGGPFPEEMQAKVALALTLACQEAERAGVRLALENVRSCWGNSGYNTALILERVNSPWLTVIWDPANGYVCGEEDAYPAGYRAIKPWISHVHLKDAATVERETGLTRWERIGDGALDYAGQLRAFAQDGFDGVLSIETHWSPPAGDPETNTRRTYAGLMDKLGAVLNAR